MANGLPVLSRAKRFVVAGDDKQMPPSNFFGAKGDVDDVLEDDKDKDLKTMFEEESLLTLSALRIERRSLSWHYRCQHESLIAFSNAAFYQGQLRSIPSPNGPAAPPAMRWVQVHDASYKEGVNEVEAERVVDTVSELLQRSEKPTVGVVTFNLKQRSTILDAIEARVSASAPFAEAWNAAASHPDLDQRPFVKNLEQVQGDERDVIVFSLGHAPAQRKLKSGGTEQYVPARFGPLGQRGGERRLNVAVSRAKKETYIVSSFEPRLLKTASAKNAGPGLFKAYLEYAHHAAQGEHASAQRILGGLDEQMVSLRGRTEPSKIPGLLPLPAQIAEALTKQGIRCERDVGASGFRIPIAAYPIEGGPRLKLAIMTDDGTDPADVFEVHVHRRKVLEQRGWTVMRVTSAQWNRKRDEVVKRIEAQLTP